MSSDLRALALKWALKNALEHNGKAIPGPVMSKMLGQDPSLKSRLAELKLVVGSVVEQVNALDMGEQRRMLLEVSPELLAEREPEREVRALPPLVGAVVGGVVTRLPPEPSGHMHLGHAMSGLLNEAYARAYKGRLWLRFEDTNPRKVRLEYYDDFRSGYRWLGIEWDYEKNNSDDMKTYYSYAKELLKKGMLYACLCSVEDARRLRSLSQPCPHRDHRPEENLELWSKMLSGGFREGEVSVRLRGDMENPNTAMRDPAMFRVVDYPHPLTGRDFWVWPTYDFAASVQDALCGVTHVLRSSEFSFRDELQNYIRILLGMRNPVFVEYSRFEFKGTPTSKRVIRSLIERGLVAGWDDPRLSTMQAVRRRGILPQTIREFTLQQTGISYAKREYDWSLIHSLNRKILDAKARRFFFVPNPVKVVVSDSPQLIVDVPFHPSRDMGTRSITVRGAVYAPAADVLGAAEGHILRFKHLMNVKILSRGEDCVYARFLGREPIGGVPIVQWVSSEYLETEVLKPGPLLVDDELSPAGVEKVSGYAETAAGGIQEGEIVQFERFGFCRRDSGSLMRFVFAHE